MKRCEWWQFHTAHRRCAVPLAWPCVTEVKYSGLAQKVPGVGVGVWGVLRTGAWSSSSTTSIVRVVVELSCLVEDCSYRGKMMIDESLVTGDKYFGNNWKRALEPVLLSPCPNHCIDESDVLPGRFVIQRSSEGENTPWANGLSEPSDTSRYDLPVHTWGGKEINAKWLDWLLYYVKNGQINSEPYMNVIKILPISMSSVRKPEKTVVPTVDCKKIK